MPAVSAVPRVMVSSPVPPVMVSVLETVALFGAGGEGQRVAAGAEVDRAVGDGGAEGDGVVAGAADEGLNVADRAGIWHGRQRELVGAAAEIDRHRGGQRATKGDGVVAGAAGDGLGVGHRGAVGEVAEGERVAAGAEVD